MTWNNGLIEKYDLIMLNLPVVAEAGIELSRRITVPEAPEEIIYSGNSFTAVYAGIAYRLATEVYLSSRSGCKIKAIALWDTGASALYQGWKMPYSITQPQRRIKKAWCKR